MNIKKECVVITGASSGIGAQTAKKFSREGYEVLLFGRDALKLKKVAAECTGPKTEYLAFDLINISEFHTEINNQLAKMSNVTVLVNNAGIYQTGLTEETSDSVWQSQFQVNLLGAVNLTRLIWPTFKKNSKGSVVNVSSTLGLKPTANTSAYSAIKAAMINWTQSLAQEGGDFSIRANCVCPGIVDTPIHAFHQMPVDEKNAAKKTMSSYQLLDFIGETTDVAEAIYFLGSDLSRWTTGTTLNVDGGINIK